MEITGDDEHTKTLSTERDLLLVRLPELGVSASANGLYAGGHFGRDNIEAAHDFFFEEPKLVKDVITTLAKHQGRAWDDKSEERPGKIHHEYRGQDLIDYLVAKEQSGQIKPEVVEKSRAIRESLIERWGETYYGAADTTPAYINLVRRFNAKYPDEHILDQKIQQKDGKERTIRESAKEATAYVTRELLQSPLGLLEYRHANAYGIPNQYFKDSITSLGPDINFHAPIAEIGNQGLAYDALESAKEIVTPDEARTMVPTSELNTLLRKKDVSELFTADEVGTMLQSVVHEQMHPFDVMKKVIQRQVLKRFWMKDEKYFASALDRDPTDDTTIRQVHLVTSNPAALLNTDIFMDLPDTEKEKYVGGIAEMILGPELLTEAGHRGRAVRHRDLMLVDGKVFSDYHGSDVAWPVENKRTAKGLEKYRLYGAARVLKIIVNNALRIDGSHQEFLNVDPEGHMLVHRLSERPQPAEGTLILNNPNLSEETQSWTASSNQIIESDLVYPRTQRPQAAWQEKLETELIGQMKKEGYYQERFTPQQIAEKRANGRRYFVDQKAGQQLDAYFRVKLGVPEWTEHKIETAAPERELVHAA